MRVFITGVAGFLGSHLAGALVERGHQVVGIDNLIGGYPDNVPQGVDWYAGDCNDFEKLKKSMRACSLVYHCAATAHEGLSVFSPYENTKHGYAASAAVFAAACSLGVRRVVFCSSMARYGKGVGNLPFREIHTPMPEDPYGIGKVASEELLKNLCETHGMEWAIAVPHNIYGSRQKYDDPFRNVVSIFANLMLQGRQPYIYGDGSQERCFSHWSDVVEPLVRMGFDPDCNRETINIGPDQEVVTVLGVARRVADQLGVTLEPVFKSARPREVKYAHCSADKAREMLDYVPSVSLDEGIHETITWIKKRGPRPFSYHNLEIEIDNMLLPETWSRRLF